jgi:hypothetical protein
MQCLRPDVDAVNGVRACSCSIEQFLIEAVDMKEAAMRQRYPSDISREQFNLIGPLLKRAWQKTRPRAVDWYEVLRGVL